MTWPCRVCLGDILYRPCLGLVGEDGVTHHGANDLAYMRTVPGMTIASPRDADQLRSLLYTSQLPDRCGLRGRYVIRAVTATTATSRCSV